MRKRLAVKMSNEWLQMLLQLFGSELCELNANKYKVDGKIKYLVSVSSFGFVWGCVWSGPSLELPFCIIYNIKKVTFLVLFFGHIFFFFFF